MKLSAKSLAEGENSNSVKRQYKRKKQEENSCFFYFFKPCIRIQLNHRAHEGRNQSERDGQTNRMIRNEGTECQCAVLNSRCKEAQCDCERLKLAFGRSLVAVVLSLFALHVLNHVDDVVQTQAEYEDDSRKAEEFD